MARVSSATTPAFTAELAAVEPVYAADVDMILKQDQREPPAALGCARQRSAGEREARGSLLLCVPVKPAAQDCQHKKFTGKTVHNVVQAVPDLTILHVVLFFS